MRIAWILGAGFSAQAGYPLAKEIDARFTDLCDPHALFRLGSSEWMWREHQNQTMHSPDGLANYFLLKELVAAYSAIATRWSYEALYQFAMNLSGGDHALRDELYGRASVSIRASEFHSEEFPLDPYIDRTQARWNLRDLFNGLISDLLRTTATEQEISAYYFPALRHCTGQQMTLDIITLNHDLLAENLLGMAGLNYSDGFTAEGSPIGDRGGRQFPVFTDAFDQTIRLFKIHGSVDLYRFEETIPIDASTSQWANRHYYAKPKSHDDRHWPKTQGLGNHNVMTDSQQPDFLTGTDKPALIKANEMYRALYARGQEALNQADVLWIIGYGFGDEHVNEMIRISLRTGQVREVVEVNKSRWAPTEWNSRGLPVSHYKDLSEVPIE